MTTEAYSTIDRDAELYALRDEIYAEMRRIRPDFSIRDAAECALGQLAGLLDYAAEWNAVSVLSVSAFRSSGSAEMETLSETEMEMAAEMVPERKLETEIPSLPTPASRKAAWFVAQGMNIVAHADGYLVPSGSRAGVVHLVKDGMCSCEAGSHGRLCWHVEAVMQQSKRAA